MRFPTSVSAAAIAASVLFAGHALAGVTPSGSGPVQVSLYYGYYGSPAGTFQSNDIRFGSNSAWYWFPIGYTYFTADITGQLAVAAAGTYNIGLYSDDGSLLYIDNALAINIWGDHGPWGYSTPVSLSAGVHTFKVQFYENGAGESGVDLVLPSGVSYTAGARVALALAGAGDQAVVSNTMRLPRTATTVNSVNIYNGGQLVINSGEQLTAPGGVAIDAGGLLASTGTVAGTVTNSGTIQFSQATLAPGRIGAATIQGGLTQLATGTALFDVGGTAQGSTYDYLHVTGRADLQGTMHVALANGFVPAVNSTYDVLTADAGVSYDLYKFHMYLPLGFAWNPVAGGHTIELTYAPSNERHYVGDYRGSWESTGSWSDHFANFTAGASVPDATTPVFINWNSVVISAPAQAASVLSNGGALYVNASLNLADYLELGNSLHVTLDASHTGHGQGHVTQDNNAAVTVAGDLTVGGQDSTYDLISGSLTVRGKIQLYTGTNALFHQAGGDVFIGTTTSPDGISSDGLLDIGSNTTYRMDAGSLNVDTIRQTGLFEFKGGSLRAHQLIISDRVYVPHAMPTPSGGTGGVVWGTVTGGGGGGGTAVVVNEGLVVFDQYSDWRLTGPEANLTIGQNPAGVGSGVEGGNACFNQTGGTVEIQGNLIVGEGAAAVGLYSVSSGGLTVGTVATPGNLILGHNGAAGYFDQSGGSVTVHGNVIVGHGPAVDPTIASSKLDLMAGTFSADAVDVGTGANPGELHLGRDATITVATAVHIGLNGQLTGSGTLNALVIDDGVVAPGNSPGSIHITSDFDQTATGTLHMQIAGAGAAGTDYDQLVVDGNVSLAGTLILDFIDGFTPATGQTFDLLQLSAGSVFTTDPGTFHVDVEGLLAGWQYTLAIDPAAHALVLTSLNNGSNTAATPEPASLALLGLGAVALLRRRSR